MESSNYNNVLTVQGITPLNIKELEKLIDKYIFRIIIKNSHINYFNIPLTHINTLKIENVSLKAIYIPDCLTHLYCSKNYLTSLVIPSNLRYLHSHSNLIETITFEAENNLWYIDLRNNKMSNKLLYDNIVRFPPIEFGSIFDLEEEDEEDEDNDDFLDNRHSYPIENTLPIITRIYAESEKINIFGQNYILSKDAIDEVEIKDA
jgi:hypothetical protein